jgi:Beta-galactosidase/beta-glucuronidase
MTDAEVRVNGQLVGPVHQGAFYEFKYDISKWLKFGGQNNVEVKVSKMSAENSVNRAERLADYWIFGGIYRPVYLACRPVENIDWTSIDAKADGSFRLAAHLNHPIAGRILQAELLDDQGNIVGTARGTISDKDSTLVLATQVKSPKLWTAETPDLYTVRLKIKKGDRAIYESSDKFGFRTIEVRKGDGIYLNGTKIKIKGINRHVFWPDYGRTTYPEADLLDVKLMKEMNLNAVRCSHYPPDKSFLRMCDSLGLYVIDELAGWQKAYATQAGKPLVKEMLIRDTNHPSIIFWSNGNEGGHNLDLVPEFAKYDISHRTVIHAHHKPGHAINGIDCNHYEDYYSTQKIVADSNIYMPTEFLHGLHDGGAAAGLADFWELHWNAKRGAGGFIWNYADEAVVRTDRDNQLDADGYNGPDGVLGPYRQKEGSAHALREIYSPVKIWMKDLPADFQGNIELENRYHFTNIRQCTFQWELLSFHERNVGHTVVHSGTAQAPDIAPVAKGSLLLQLPADWKRADVLALRATDPHGAEIYRWTWPIKTNQSLLAESFADPIVSMPFEISDREEMLTIKTGAVALTFDQNTGLLAAVKSSKNSVLSFNNGPVLVRGEATFDHLSHRKQGADYVVEVYYKGALDRVQWKISPNGCVTLNYRYTLHGKYPFAGVSFDYPENLVTGIKWLGRGPGRVWKNRLQGQHFDVFEKQYNPTTTGRSPWIYPEFNGYYANVVWMELQTMEGSFMVGSPDKDLFVRLFDFYAIYGAQNHPRLPGGNISFLDRIPAIGSNLKTGAGNDVSNMGPSSEPNVLDGPLERTLYFYFGTPGLPASY